jgi:hypothetical protein
MKKILILLAACTAMTGCSNVKQQLGLVRRTPDEFAVVKRAPLEIPPDLEQVAALPPPRPGAQRPQEESPERAAQAAILGTPIASSAAPSGAEAALLQKTGAAQTDPNIRDIVNRETAEIAESSKPVVRRIFNLETESAADVLDADEEARRLGIARPPAPAPASETR